MLNTKELVKHTIKKKKRRKKNNICGWPTCCVEQGYGLCEQWGAGLYGGHEGPFYDHHHGVLRLHLLGGPVRHEDVGPTLVAVRVTPGPRTVRHHASLRLVLHTVHLCCHALKDEYDFFYLFIFFFFIHLTEDRDVSRGC